MADYTDHLVALQDSAWEQEPHEGDVVARAEPTAPLAGVVSHVEHRDRVTLYNTRTGELVQVNRWQVYLADGSLPPSSLLRKLHTDDRYPEWLGKPVFSRNPTVPYVQGTFKCWLHPTVDDRKLYDEWGLIRCNSAKLASPYEVIAHMQKKHKREYATIKEYQDRMQREEDRDLQRSMARALLSQAGQPVEEPAGRKRR